MTTVPFNDGWTFRRGDNPSDVTVDVPHDAMLHERRAADAPSWAHGAYFPGGRYTHRKTWQAPEDLHGKQVVLRFEGVYRHTRVLLDGHDIGGSLGGYTEFEVRLDPRVQPGSTHEIVVDVDNSETPNARWYTGSGIYRPVWLEIRDRVHLATDGIAFRTASIADPAHVEVDVHVSNPDRSLVDLTVSLRRDGDTSATTAVSTTGDRTTTSLTVPAPALWSADEPNLYDLVVEIGVDGTVIDRRTSRVGLRVVELDAANGLRVNGVPVLLRGANVHHDSGILGAATFPAAERRRVRVLRHHGFNAIRCAHNPAARALLDACDELGMYVLDELFDGWYDHKTDHDDADLFEQVWRTETAAFVAKDRNRPSVIMYSIGNENGEALTPRGRVMARQIADDLRRRDPTRAVTIGVNMVAATFAGVSGAYRRRTGEVDGAGSAPDMTSTTLNLISNRFGALMKVVPRLRAADAATRDLFGIVDVAGYNYGTARYAADATLHPERVMVGTESMPGDIAQNWALTRDNPGLIGDFMWAGWDYLGEAGGGSWAYGTRRAPYLKPYPQLTSGTGALDITGEPGAPMALARAAWGLLDAPQITVRPLDVTEGAVAKTSWRSTDAVPSWSWSGHEGRRAEIEVYAADDEVELLLDGRTLGRRAAGPGHGFVARFTTTYAPGLLEAVGYRNGRQVSRSSLASAGPVRLRLRAETAVLRADGLDIGFVRIDLADDDGVVDCAVTDIVTVTVDGPASLAGLGNGASSSEESFVDDVHSTFRGRALLAIRAGHRAGRVTVTVRGRRYGTATVSVDVASASVDG